MDAQQKLELLADAGRHDLACSCGTRNPDDHRKRADDGVRWLFPVSLASGGSGIMFKTLLSSSCVGDCAYCPLRASADTVRRCTLGAEELANLFLEYNKRQWLLGLFISSGIIRDPDHTMMRLNAVAAILRRKHKYKGYIHTKIIPGASDEAVREAISLSSAVSVNIETPNAGECAALSTRKDWEKDVFGLMKRMTSMIREQPRRVRQSTQFIVGAAAETDRDIVGRVFDLYKDLRLERAYFSAYQRGQGASSLPGEEKPDDRILVREHRLYQTDFLIRRYGFAREDIVFDEKGGLSRDVDPKTAWAKAHPEFFPLPVRTADREELLRVPGLGPITVDRILKARKETTPRSISDFKLPKKRAELAASYLSF